jgi:GTPase involved in cell partitioning and DNA repair
VLQSELEAYNPSLLKLPCLLVANKVDALPASVAAAALAHLKSVTQLPIVPVSAKNQAGLKLLQEALHGVARKVQQTS